MTTLYNLLYNKRPILYTENKSRNEGEQLCKEI